MIGNQPEDQVSRIDTFLKEFFKNLIGNLTVDQVSRIDMFLLQDSAKFCLRGVLRIRAPPTTPSGTTTAPASKTVRPITRVAITRIMRITNNYNKAININSNSINNNTDNNNNNNINTGENTDGNNNNNENN